MYETMKECGYRHEKVLEPGVHVLFNLKMNRYEVWACNKNHASHGLIYKNTHLEFVRDYYSNWKH